MGDLAGWLPAALMKGYGIDREGANLPDPSLGRQDRPPVAAIFTSRGIAFEEENDLQEKNPTKSALDPLREGNRLSYHRRT